MPTENLVCDAFRRTSARYSEAPVRKSSIFSKLLRSYERSAGRFALSLGIALFLRPATSRGLELTWDTQPALGGAQGGSDGWHDDNHWLVGATNIDWPNVSSNALNATFAGTGGTVDFGARNTGVDKITFASSGYRITGSTGRLDANLSGGFINIVVNSGISATIDALITDFEKLGSGTLTLVSDTEANFGITAGTVIMDGNSALSAIVRAGGTLQIDNTVQFTGNVQGGGNITVNGTIDTFLSLSGDITGNGRLNLRGGTLSGTNTVAEMAFLEGTTTLATSTSAGLNTQLIVSSGSVALGADLTVSALQSSVSPTGVVNLGAHSLTVQSGSSSAAITGTGSLRKIGAGKLTLNGNSTFGGSMDIVVGTISLSKLANIGAASPVGSGVAINLGNGAGNGILEYTGSTVSTNRSLALVGTGTNTGGALDVTNAATTLTWSGGISGTGPLRKNGPGTLVLNGPNTLTGELRVQGGVVRIAANDSLDSVGRVVFSNTAGVALELQAEAVVGGLSGGGANGGNLLLDINDLTVNQATDETFSGQISGSGRLTKSGVGQLTLARANTWTGPISVSGGILRLANLDAASTAGTVTIASGSQLALDVDAAIGGLSGGGTVVLGTRALTITQSGNTSFSGVITGTAAATTLRKRGTGTLTLTNGTTSFTQPLAIEAGTLSVPAIANAGAISPMGAGAGLTLGGAATAGTLRFTGTTGTSDRTIAIAAGGGGLDVQLSAGRLEIGGVISGSGALTKRGGGTFVAANANSTFGGALTIEDGTWETASWRNSGTASGFGTGGTISLGLSGAGGVTTIRYTGATAASNRSLVVNGSGEVELGTATTDFTLNGALSGSGALFRKDGPGRLVLAADGSFSGAIQILGGPLQLAHVGALDGASGVSLTNSAGTSLELADIASGSYIIPNLSGNAPTGSGLMLGAEAATLLETAATTFLGAIFGNGSATLTKAGPETLTLSGQSTFQQTLQIAEGTVSIAVANATANPGPLGATPSIVLGTEATNGVLRYTGGSAATNSRLISVPGAGGGTINITDSAWNQTGAVIGNGPLFKLGAGTLTFSNGNSYTGAASIVGGTLGLNHPAALAQASLVTVGDFGLLSLAVDSSLTAIAGNGIVALNSNSLTLTGSANVTLSSLVTGSSAQKSVTKRGGGTLTLANSGNSFTQSLSIEDGAVSVTTLRSAGQAGPIGSGSTISLGALGTQGALVVMGSTQSSDRAITLNLGGGVIDVANSNTTLSLTGPITGPGALVKNGTGRVSLQGMSTFSGNLLVQSGELIAGSIANAGVASNVGSGSLIGLAPGAQLTFLGIDGAPGSTNRSIFLSGGGSISTAADLTVTGGISGSTGGGFEKRGSGKLVLGGTNTFPSAFMILEGELRVLGSIGAGTAVGVSGGLLTGIGAIERSVTVTAGGVLAPGVPTGTLNTGGLTFSSGVFQLRIDSGSAFSQVNVTGSVSLSGSPQIALTLGYDPIDFVDTFVALRNDGADAVSGRFFAGGTQLAEGGLFLAGGQAWQISYSGGDGNDVVLAAVPEPASLGLMATTVPLLLGLRRRRSTRSGIESVYRVDPPKR